MAKQPTFNVHAAMKPDGRGERVNTLNHKTFHFIDKMFQDHNEWRWLVVEYTGRDAVLPLVVIDLWHTSMVSEFPYKEPGFITETFENIEQAMGWIALNATSLT